MPLYWGHGHGNEDKSGCPSTDRGVVWISNNAKALKDRIDNLKPAFSTSMDHGVLWGAKALSPQFRGIPDGDFSDRPSTFDQSRGGNRKVMVVMSDGKIRSQIRPVRSTQETIDLFHGNTPTQVVLEVGEIGDDYSDRSAIGYYNAMCDILKENGAAIYTIGYELHQKGTSFSIEKMQENEDANTILKSCASSESHHFVSGQSDIGEVFAAIASSITKLRISE